MESPRIQQILDRLSFCPVCGGPLEPHPVRPQVKACYGHGDFSILTTDDRGVVYTEYRILAGSWQKVSLVDDVAD